MIVKLETKLENFLVFKIFLFLVKVHKLYLEHEIIHSFNSIESFFLVSRFL